MGGILPGMKWVGLGAVLLAGVAVAGLLGGDDTADARRAIDRANELAAQAPYVVRRSGARADVYARDGTLVLRRRGRVLNWTDTRAELVFSRRDRCYVRVTDFNRDDLRDLRRTLVPDLEFARDVELDGRSITYVEDHGSGIESRYEIRLDDAGRAVLIRERTGERAGETRLRYPASVDVSPPGPRC
jgi:hypothetical protein